MLVVGEPFGFVEIEIVRHKENDEKETLHDFFHEVSCETTLLTCFLPNQPVRARLKIHRPRLQQDCTRCRKSDDATAGRAIGYVGRTLRSNHGECSNPTIRALVLAVFFQRTITDSWRPWLACL